MTKEQMIKIIKSKLKEAMQQYDVALNMMDENHIEIDTSFYQVRYLTLLNLCIELGLI